MKKSPVVHFEMPYQDSQRVSKFYNSVFGWEMTDAGPEMGHYMVATTTDTDPQTTRPTTPGAINGGFYAKTNATNPYPSFVIAVDDVKQSIEMVKKAGGKIISEPQEIPGIGLWAVFEDTEGNKVSMLQPKM